MDMDHFNNPALISIGAGKSQNVLIKKMKELGYAVIAVDRNPTAQGFSYSDECLYLSTYEAKPIIEELRKLENKYDIKGVFTRSSGPPVVTTAFIADYFNLPGPTEKAAALTVDKSKLMRLCQFNNIVTPQSQLIDETNYFDLIASQLPCIVKPALDIVGKRGIRLIRKKDEIELAYTTAKKSSYSGNVLLENYVSGTDAILMSVIADGKVYPVVLLKELNEFDLEGKLVAKGISMPYDPGKRTTHSIYDLAQSVVDVTGIQYSPFLMSCRCSKNSAPILIEAHLDFGGDGILDELFPKCTQFDFIAYTLEIMLGLKSPYLIGKANFKHAEIKGVR